MLYYQRSRIRKDDLEKFEKDINELVEHLTKIDNSKCTNEIKAKIDEAKGIKLIGKAGLDTYAGDVTVIANTASSSDFSFIIPGVILDNLVSLTDEDELTLNISPVPSNEWHGRGIEISTPTFKAVCTRFVD